MRDSLVFVGGCATGLLVTSVRAQPIRMTKDVDVVTQAATAQEYHAMEGSLRKLGFANDMTAGAPICRWIYRGMQLDLMPSSMGVLGFHNRWYPYAIESAQPVALPSGLSIRLISAPVFVATKLEAFKGRGDGDYLLSHDLEDITTVVDGRASLLEEIVASPASLRRYLAGEVHALLATNAFLDALPGRALSMGTLGAPACDGQVAARLVQ